MREERTRRDRRLAADERSGSAARRLTVVLGFVALVMVGLVVYRYWPAWVADWGSGFLSDAGARVETFWTETGGRWVTLVGVVGAVIVATILARSHRTLAIVIVEIAVAAGAVLVLVQPAGW
jgi:hypothetical protein